MRILIKNGRIIDPASGWDRPGPLAIAHGCIVGRGQLPDGFEPQQVIDASGCWVIPGLVDLAARLREPGCEHQGMLASELAAAVAGGVTSLVCLPDTDPALDEPGPVEMLRFRAQNLHQARVFPLGALTRGLQGENLTDMVALHQAGCIGFSQAEHAVTNTQVLYRALQYAATFDYPVWLRAQDAFLGTGIAASGALATRLGLSGVPVAAETIALHTLFELMRLTGGAVHICRLSSAQGLQLLRQARAQGLRISCDVSINSLHLTDADIAYFDSSARLNPPLRQQRDRDALREGLADGSINALVSDHTPVDANAKALPFGQAEPGASGLELLLSLTLKWGQERGLAPLQTLATVTSAPAHILSMGAPSRLAGCGRLQVNEVADVCVFDPHTSWTVQPAQLRSQGKHTPFNGYELPGRVRWTLVNGQLRFGPAHP